MIDKKLKTIWVEAALSVATQERQHCAPTRFAFSRYLGDFFRKEALGDITNENFNDNLPYIEKMLEEDKPKSTMTTQLVIDYFLRTLPNAPEAN